MIFLNVCMHIPESQKKPYMSIHVVSFHGYHLIVMLLRVISMLFANIARINKKIQFFSTQALVIISKPAVPLACSVIFQTRRSFGMLGNFPNRLWSSTETLSYPTARSTKSARLSPLCSDLGMPIFPDRGTASRFANASQAATASALWRDTGISADLPAPPVFTLDDRIRFFGLGDLPSPPSDRTGSLSPAASSSSSSSSFVRRTRAEMSGSRAAEVDGEERETGRGSPIDRLIEPGALITPPPPRPREIVKPGSQGCSMQNGGLGADGWVTVYGFPPSDTNMVLREFEKCGVISKHVHGPSTANWIHILYQNPSEAQMALKKNGMQLNSLLIIAVKRIDPMHRHHLDETSDRLNRGSFMVSLPSKSTTLNSSSTGTPSTVLTRAHHQQSIATPATSALSKVMDLIFGI
ncbi:unnamed protein product [Musa hybrid cultivar]